MNALANWFERHAKALQAITGLLTAVLAIVALAGVKWQIDASARIQREQSARDIYREFLNLSIARPEFADPDYCAIAGGNQEGAYQNYVEYLLYTGDQLLSTSPEWEATLDDHLSGHRAFLCGKNDWTDDSPQVQAMMVRFQARHCKTAVPACAE